MATAQIDRRGMAPRPDHVPEDRVVDFDIYFPKGGTEDFHAAWRALQDAGVPEIIWTPRNEGHWIVTSGRLVSHLFADYERFSSHVLFVPKSDGVHHQLPPSTIDPPTHRPYRNLLTGGLSPRAVAKIEHSIRKLAIRLIDGFRLDGRCDFATDFAEKLPINTFMDMVELPMADAPKIKYWSDQTTRPDGSMPYGDAIQALIDYIVPVAEARRGADRDDLITHIVNGRIGDRAPTQKEAGELCAQILIAGADTVVNIMGFIMLYLAQDAENRRRLAEDPSLIGSAVEELIRRFPIVSDGREIAEDMIFEGVVMKKGEMVVMPTVLHGLDERENEDALRVDFDRTACRHSTFGNGAHKCPGAHLARTEIKITLEEWLKRIPDFEVEPGTKLTYTCGVNGSVDAIPLVWDPVTTIAVGA
jgi:cytochrome P450